jgi:hypothetical protein
MEAPMLPEIRWDAGAGTGVSGGLGDAGWIEDEGAIQFGNGRVLHGCSRDAWAFVVSGRPLLPQWFASRQALDGQSLTTLTEIRRTVNAVAQLAALAPEMDDYLMRVLTAPLRSRE